jgi:hypothetical protein
VGAAGGARAALFASSVALLGVSCTLLSPQTGDERMACVDADSNPAVPVSFKKDIRPIMDGAVPGSRGCKGCHYENDPTGTHEGYLNTGLNLESLRELRLGGRNTPPTSIVVAGKPCSSAIVKKLQGTFGGARMPKDGPYWNEGQIQLVIDWIAEGAQGADTD